MGVRLEQANQLLAAWHRLAGKDAALGLGDDALDQRQIMPDLAEPGLGLGSWRLRPDVARRAQACSRWRGEPRSVPGTTLLSVLCPGCIGWRGRASWPAGGRSAR